MLQVQLPGPEVPGTQEESSPGGSCELQLVEPLTESVPVFTGEHLWEFGATSHGVDFRDIAVFTGGVPSLETTTNPVLVQTPDIEFTWKL